MGNWGAVLIRVIAPFSPPCSRIVTLVKEASKQATPWKWVVGISDFINQLPKQQGSSYMHIDKEGNIKIYLLSAIVAEKKCHGCLPHFLLASDFPQICTEEITVLVGNSSEPLLLLFLGERWFQNIGNDSWPLGPITTWKIPIISSRKRSWTQPEFTRGKPESTRSGCQVSCFQTYPCRRVAQCRPATLFRKTGFWDVPRLLLG